MKYIYLEQNSQIVMDYKSLTASSMTSLCFYVTLVTFVLLGVAKETYSLSPESALKTEFACENENLSLTCSGGEVIRIDKAYYGRFTMSKCNPEGKMDGWDTRCANKDDAKNTVAVRCDGRNVCVVPVNSDVFLDKCTGTFKYAEVKFTCEKAVPETPEPTKLKPAHPIWLDANTTPKPPIINSVMALSPTTIQITWTLESPVVTTAIYWTPLGIKTMSPITAATKPLPNLLYVHEKSNQVGLRKHMLTGLIPNTTYEIFLRPFAKGSNGPPTKSVYVTTLPDDTTTSKQTLIDSEVVPSVTLPIPKFEPNDHHRWTSKHIHSTTTTSTKPITKHQTIKPPTLLPSLTAKPEDVWIPPTIDKDVHTSAESIFDNEGVSDKVCPKVRSQGVLWPATKFGHIKNESCPGQLDGNAFWRCLDNGWDQNGPDFSNCISKWVTEINTDINNVKNGGSQADIVAVKLSDMIKSKQLSSGDLKKMAQIFLPNLLEGMKIDDDTDPWAKRQKMKTFRKAFVSTGSTILNTEHADSWRSLSKHERAISATFLMMKIEELGFQSTKLMDVSTKEIDVDSNIVIEIQKIDTTQAVTDVLFPSKNGHLSSHSDWSDVSDSIFIPSDNLRLNGQNGVSNIVFCLYNNLEDLMQPQFKSKPLPFDNRGYTKAETIKDINSVEKSDNQMVNSRIISASLFSDSRYKRKLNQPVKFVLKHHNTQASNPICSYWNVTSSQWNSDGCSKISSNSTHTTCSCNHLTNFAILMDVTGSKFPEGHELALRVITYIGCIVSIICLILSCSTFIIFKNLQCDRNTIHKNLVLCLLIAEIIFLVGITQTEIKIVCSVIAGVLHYLFLGAFAWMCLEGVQLYVMLVEVFEQERSRVKWYYLFGYGVPLVIVIVSAAVNHQGYGTERHCWLSTDKAFIWSFVGPALAVMLVNIVMLGIAIYTMCRHSNMSATMKERSKVAKFSMSESQSSMETFASPKIRFPDLPAWLKGAMVLVVLLGLTWLLGVMYLSNDSPAFAYLFTILNSLQGMFIFVFHCIMNEKVQKEYRKVARKTTWLPNCIRVNYGGYNGVASSSPVASSGTGNYLSKLFGQGKRKRSAVSTNSSAKPFLSNDQRRSDLESSSSHDTSNAPVSLNGYIYTPGYADNHNYSGCKVSSFKNIPKPVINMTLHLAPCCETDGVIGDLSEYQDCSRVESEFVSEYFEHNMQVSMDEKRYSSGSEESKKFPTVSLKDFTSDNLSTLSLASSSRKGSSLVSSLEVVPGCEQKLSTHSQKDLATTDPKLNLNQYIIPSSKKVITNHKGNNTNSNDSQPQLLDVQSGSMNKLTKTAVSLSSIPETDSSPQQASNPNIQFSLSSSNQLPESSYIPTPPRHYQFSDNEDISPNLKSNSHTSKSSLPNLDMLTIKCEHFDQNCINRRHSAEPDNQFSPYCFTATEC